ncbi:MAG: M23 family metallopeptidase [Alphaproteobacteria bacterium]
MLIRAALLGVLLLLPAAGWAHELRLEGPFVQGGLVRGFTEPGAHVHLNGRAVRVSPEGLFLIGFGPDARGPFVLEVRFPDGRVATRRLEVGERRYGVQRIDGLPAKMVTPDEAALRRIREENAMIAAARARDTAAAWFAEGVNWPLVGPITGVFGTRRILNGEPRRPHYGVDVAAPEGTPVEAAASGLVALEEPDLYFTGGTVILDHGHGLTTLYAHLGRIEVEEGETVARGEIIGAVGATGRVTGPHLDWRVNLFDTRLDPALVAGPMPQE